MQHNKNIKIFPVKKLSQDKKIHFSLLTKVHDVISANGTIVNNNIYGKNKVRYKQNSGLNIEKMYMYTKTSITNLHVNYL